MTEPEKLLHDMETTRQRAETTYSAFETAVQDVAVTAKALKSATQPVNFLRFILALCWARVWPHERR